MWYRFVTCSAWNNVQMSGVNSLLIPDFQYLPSPREVPEYLAEAKALLAEVGVSNVGGFSMMRLERSILRNGVWQQMGTRVEQHFIRFLAHLVPSIECDPWCQERVWSFYDTRRRGRSVTNWHGSQNAGKTMTMAGMANAHGVLWHDKTRQIVSGPIKESGDSEIWGQMNSIFEEVSREHKRELAGMGLSMKQTESKFALRFSDIQRAGSIRFVAIDGAGKVQGGKARDRLQQDGYVLFWLDEIGVWDGRIEFLDALPNLSSNENLHVVTACNPKNPEGELDGELSRPKGGFGTLRMEHDYVWESEKYGAVTYRFDGLKSPNLLHGNQWPWLFDRRREQRLQENHGFNSPKYNEQCRAFMGTGIGLKYVLTQQDLINGLVDQPFLWSQQEKWKVGYLDPALSNGGDDAVFTILEGGQMQEGEAQHRPIVELAKQVRIDIQDRRNGPLFVDAEWIRRCELVRGKKDAAMEMGAPISVEEELAIKAAELCWQEGISYRDFGYDDSMRGKVMVAFQWAMGDAPLVVSYVGEPDDAPMFPSTWTTGADGRRRLRTWKEECQKFVSQIWFQGAAVVRSGMFRFKPGFDRWAAQGRRRLWKETAAGKKRDVESRQDYSERPPKESPDYADSLFGAIHVAARRAHLRLTVDKAIPHEGSYGRETISSQWRNRKPQRGLFTTGTK